MRDKTPSVAANALAEVATAAGHTVNTYPERLTIVTDAGTLRVTWGGGTAAEWSGHAAQGSDGEPHWTPVTLSQARRLIS